MAVELEQTVMREIGLGANYRWFNGSGSCEYIRREAVDKLANVASKYGLLISPEWLCACQAAIAKDNTDGDRFKTNGGR